MSYNINKFAKPAVRQRIFPKFHQDHVVEAIRYDYVVIFYANSLTSKYRESQFNDKMIRAKLRLLGRFIIECRKISEEKNQRDNKTKKVHELKDIICGPGVPIAIEAICVLTDPTEDGSAVKYPAVATSLRTMLHEIACLYRAQCNIREAVDVSLLFEKFF